MKVLIISDTHRRDDRFLALIERIKPIDMLIHCGDTEGSEELYQLGAHLNDFLPRLQCSRADFISHIITSCSDLVL